jgi:hypothetical protein
MSRYAPATRRLIVNTVCGLPGIIVFALLGAIGVGFACGGTMLPRILLAGENGAGAALIAVSRVTHGAIGKHAPVASGWQHPHPEAPATDDESDPAPPGENTMARLTRAGHSTDWNRPVDSR